MTPCVEEGGLGILVCSGRHFSHVLELARAAAARGRNVRIHLMGPGLRLLEAEEYPSLAAVARITRSEVPLSGMSGPAGSTSPSSIGQEKAAPVQVAEVGEFLEACERHVVF